MGTLSIQSIPYKFNDFTIPIASLSSNFNFFKENSLNMLPLTLCVFGLTLIKGHKLDGAQFSQKSSYFTVGNFDESSLEVIRNSQNLNYQ